MMERLRRFMIGRYGVDELSYAFLVLFIILNFISFFVKSAVITFIYIALLIFFFYRILSKNIAARRKENYFFLKLWRPVAAFFRTTFTKLRNIRRYKYLTCKSCGKKMRVPRKKGNIIVTCPECGNRIRIRT